MRSEFMVKVVRYCECEDGTRIWGGWFISKVFAIRDYEFLVYDEGDEDIAGGFEWVDFTEMIPDCNSEIDGSEKRIPKVQRYGG